MALKITKGLLLADLKVFEISKIGLAAPAAQLLTDAASEGRNCGLGGLIYRRRQKTKYVQKLGRVNDLPDWFRNLRPSITTYELLAVLLSLWSLGKQNERVIMHIDSAGAVYSCAKGADSNSIVDNAIVAAICQICRENNTKPYFAHISTKRNPADPVSRLKPIKEYLKTKGLNYQRIEL